MCCCSNNRANNHFRHIRVLLAWSNVWHALNAFLFSRYSPFLLHKAAYFERWQRENPLILIPVAPLYVVSVTKQQQQSYSTVWRTKQVLRMPLTQAKALSLTRGQFGCTWIHWGLGYFNIGAASHPRQGWHGNGSGPGQEMRPEVGLETMIQ